MSVELVTGKAGVPHISSEDIGAYQAATIGSGVIQLENPTGTFPVAALQDANRVVIPPMNLLIDGRYIRVTTAETVTITSGATGYRRRDLICLRYTRDASTGVEQVAFTALKGQTTSGTTLTSPTVSGRIIHGATTATYAIAAVDLDGITPNQPVMLTHKVAPIGQRSSAPVWETLKPLTGWSAVEGHTPRISIDQGIVTIEGAVRRGTGGALDRIVEIPAKYLPATGTQFLGASVAAGPGGKTAASQLYVASEKRVLSDIGYTSIDSGPGWTLPISCTYRPRS